MIKWEHIADNDAGYVTERLRVPGGWLVVNRKDYHGETTRPVFIRDPEHMWGIE